MKAILELLRPPSGGEPGDGGGRALIYVWALEQKDSRRGWDEGNEQDIMVPWVMRAKKEKEGKKARGQKSSEQAAESAVKDESSSEQQQQQQPQDKTFLRYYHLYKKGELEQIIEEAGGKVVEAGYDRDNWWAITERRS